LVRLFIGKILRAPNKKIEADIGKSGQRRLIWCYLVFSFFTE